MADGTRLRALDDGLKVLQESHKQMQDSHAQMVVDQKELRADINLIATSMEDQKKTLNNLLVQMSHAIPKTTTGESEFWYNTSYQTSAQMTPFEVVYGRPPPTISRYVKDTSGNALVDAQLLQRDEVLSLLKTNLLKAQHRMKLAADKTRRDLQFQVGDWVYVKLQPYRQGSLRLQIHYKLGRRYFGPYPVLARVGPVAYKLALPDSAKIHNVFHVSLLRKCNGIPEQQITPLELVNHSSTMVLQPVAILDTRSIHRGEQLVEQFLAQWRGLPSEAATWEDKATLLASFPSVHLEDKVIVKEGVMLWIHYKIKTHP
ncbi:hypothetical protein E3N88_43279 [Mikania micrantha]|uniref:Chromo domain-containing protein n=1 Tax=Mikania micrantha TaxID=192012 RepID=A0A5N6LFE1_9ASTR|nr:hypothetical protein E3N88_43279 [Mikania micrantha]